MTQVRCEGGALDGQVLDREEVQATIHQNGMVLLRVWTPYPKKAGERAMDRLLTWMEDYNLVLTEQGPVYRCVAPFGGVFVGGVAVVPSEGGGCYEVFADKNGKLWPTREARDGASSTGDPA